MDQVIKFIEAIKLLNGIAIGRLMTIKDLSFEGSSKE